MASETTLKPYICYIHREGRSIADMEMLFCESDRAVASSLESLLKGRTGVLFAEVYDADRRVMVKHASLAA